MEEQSWEWEQLAFCLAFFVGLFQIVMGLLRVGFVVNFISEAVIVGFTTGAAFLIAAAQVGVGTRVYHHALYDVLMWHVLHSLQACWARQNALGTTTALARLWRKYSTS